MNADLVRRRARERRFAAELAEVLAVPISAVVEQVPQPRRIRWLAAAIAVLGVGIAVAVATLQRGDGAASLQEPKAFDPVYPEHLESVTRFVAARTVRTVADVDLAPADCDAFQVVGAGLDADAWASLLTAVAARKGVRLLACNWRGRGERLPASVWTALGAMSALELLIVGGDPGCRPVELRELRHAPNLRSLWLGDDATGLDQATAQALVELPHLEQLALLQTPVTAQGIEALAGLPHLGSLLLSGVRWDGELPMASIATLRQLRVLVLEQSHEQLSAEQVALLARLPRLRVLDLAHMGLDDAALRALPRGLESLALSGLGGVTPEGLRSLMQLARLRSLTFRSRLGPSLRPVLVELVEELPLENLGLLVEQPSPELWRVLADRPGLRGLSIPSGPSIPDHVAHCSSLLRLERLSLSGGTAPTPADLAPLRDHPTLRRIDIHVISGEVAAAELRAAVGPDIEVVIR